MKAWFVFPLVFLAGLLIGGAQPRSELRRLRGELETRKKVESAPVSQSRQLSSFFSMLPMETPRPAEDSASGPGANRLEPAAESASDTASTHAESGANAPKNWRTMSAEERATEFKARMEQAAEAWRLRADLARAGFASKTGFTDSEMTEFDVLTKAMNVRLEDLFRQTADQIKAGEPFSPETGIRLMNGLTDAMVLTYDEMDRKLPATWRKDSGNSFDLVTYVDPVVVAPLMEVQDKLPAPGGPGRGGGPFGGRFGGGRPGKPPAP